ncbi:TPA: ABC-three component system middle component 7 [Streptococcus agalactiae]
MQLPNKLYSYQKSTLAYLPRVLNEIKGGNSNVKDIFHTISEELEDPTDFLSIMDCLYTLNAIEMTNEGEVTLCL